jgi:hypothetical protein
MNGSRAIASGRHTVTCTNPGLGINERRTVVVEPGKTAAVVFRRQ